MVVISNAVLFAAKPEIVFPLDDSRLAELSQMKDLAIGEMAGRDSVAAILAALESDDVGAVLPVAAPPGSGLASRCWTWCGWARRNCGGH